MNTSNLKNRNMKKERIDLFEVKSGKIASTMTETTTAAELVFIPKPNKVTVNIKPLSVNECWQGKRFKTPAYKSYERELLLTLPKIVVPPGKIKIILEFGVSNMQSDWDNPVKPFVDILQKKYWFNDCNIWEAEVRKIKVAKGSEYVTFEFISIV